MTPSPESIPSRAVIALRTWLDARLSPDQRAWLDEKRGQIASDADLFLAVAMTPRKLGKADLNLTPEERAEADRVRTGWNPSQWSVDQAARLLLLIGASPEPADFLRRLEKLRVTADVGELVMLHRGLPLYPAPERLRAFAAEGVRSNIRPAYEAVAHDNPYPAEQFDDDAWNQMVLKALFIGSRLAPIQGLDRRANPALAGMLTRFAHERWAAGRTVPPELWRCVGPFADEEALEDLQRAFRSAEPKESAAAALALQACPRPAAKALLAERPDLLAAIQRGALTWDTFSS